MPNVPLSIVVIGAAGRMGQQVVQTVLDDPSLTLVGAVDHNWTGQDVAIALGRKEPVGLTAVAQLNDLPADLKADVAIEFTTAATVYEITMALIDRGMRPLIGATGLTPDQLTDLDKALKDHQLSGAFVPNFSVGAVLMMRFAQEASRYFDHAEIIELHHNRKADAPSGTALHTAAGMANTVPSGQFGPSNLAHETELLPGARGGTTEAGIHIHSVRLPGLFAHQEVLLASEGQLLTLRHDSFSRGCYMPGVTLAAKGLPDRPVGLTQGLETFMA
jgi:4-hydroxy-tetrahydrodipicolinate reductase